MGKDRVSLRWLAAAVFLSLLPLLSLSLTTALGQRAHTSQIIELDDFSERGRWPTGTNRDFEIEYTSDGLRIFNNFFRSYVSTVRGFPADLFIEVEVERTGGPAASYAGAVCRWQDVHNYYVFAVFSDGRYGILRILDSEVEVLAGGQASAEQFNSGRPNRVGGICEDSTLTLSLNGAALIQTQDATFSGGAAGMMVGTLGSRGAEALFTELIVGSPRAVSGRVPVLIPPTGPDESVYFVRPGDTLSEIAFAHNLTVAGLLAANPQIENPRLIFSGQALVIPVSGATPPTAVPSPTLSPSPSPLQTPTASPTPTAENPPVFFIPETGAGEQLYTVKSGDTLAQIAEDFEVAEADLAARNPHIIHPDLLIPGQRLAIPRSGAEPGLPAPPGSQPEKVLYEDDFSGGQWWAAGGDHFSVVYTDNAYHMTNRLENGFFTSVLSYDYTDIHVEAEGVQVAGPSTGYSGVVCRWQNQNNFYAFVLRADGLAAILRILDGQVYILHGDPTIRADVTKPNRVRGSCVGPTLTLSINETLVVAAQDETFSSGYIGVVAGGLPGAGLEVNFLKFSLLNP